MSQETKEAAKRSATKNTSTMETMQQTNNVTKTKMTAKQSTKDHPQCITTMTETTRTQPQLLIQFSAYHSKTMKDMTR